MMRKPPLWLLPAADLLAVGLIPLNLYVLAFPEWIVWAAVVVLAALHVLLWRGKRPGVGGKLALSILGMLAAGVCLLGSCCNPYWSSISFREDAARTVRDDSLTLTGREAARELDWAMHYLKKLHPAALHGLPAQTQERYRAARTALAAADMIDITELTRQTESVLSTLGDAHTYAGAKYNAPHTLRFLAVEQAAGSTITAVNGETLEALLARNTDRFSYEMESLGIARLRQMLRTKEGLAYLGIPADGAVYTFSDEAGSHAEYVCRDADFVPPAEFDRLSGVQSAGETAFVRYELDPARDLAVLTLDECRWNDTYRDTLQSFFAEVQAAGIGNVAVDLRRNGGGNSLVGDAFISYLNTYSYRSWGMRWRLGPFVLSRAGDKVKNDRQKDLLFRGNVYVLTSAQTFSAAMDFAMLIHDNGLGTLIGEPPGNLPDSYGDVAFFSLPRSGIFMQISTKQWTRIDETLAGTPIEPEVPCPAADAMKALYRELERN